MFLVYRFKSDQKIQEKDQLAMIKSDEELLGKHLYIKRENKNDIDVNIYSVDGSESRPLVINLHGGAFIAGDADTLDTQSYRISKSWNVNVATINYSLLKNEITKDDVIGEITDTVKYFIAEKETYHIDPDDIFIMGYSAGGYYAMASTLALHKENIAIKGQILCYAFISDILDQYNLLSDNEKNTIPQALFVIADGDPIGEASLNYEKVLKENSVDTTVLRYEHVKHGFIEENNPEYEKLHAKNKSSKSEEAEKIARKAEDDIKLWLHGTIK